MPRSLLKGLVSQQTSPAVGGKYFSLYVLLAGILGGVFLLFSLFLFCKFCRGKSRQGINEGEEWTFGNGSLGLNHNDSPESIREREGTVVVRRGSNTRSQYAAIESGLHEGDLEEGRKNRVITPTREGDDHGKSSIFLQRQKSLGSKEPSSPLGCGKNSEQTVECEVAVEVHSGHGGSGGTGGPTSSGVSGGHSSLTPPLHTHLSTRHQQSKECRSWGGSEDDGEGVNGDGEGSWGRGRGRGRVPWRASSTDWTRLESSLDFWQQEHSRPLPLPDDSDKLSKVRYNDTGSLEEVNVVNLVDYFVEDDLMLHLESDKESIRQQYKMLWQLRATFEEDEDKKHLLNTPTAPPPTPSLKSAAPMELPDPNLQPQSSPDQSPEMEITGSHTTSFESNTEPLLDESGKWPPHLLQLPSYEARRQTYRNILSLRLHKMDARNQRHPHTHQTSLEDTSFDSMDTADTEGSSTDASRLDQVIKSHLSVATTSFESTTDNTDSTSESQVHRLHQLRADSGYRSLENPVPPTLKLIYHQHLSSGDFDTHTHRIPSLGESVEEGSEGEEGEEGDEIFRRSSLLSVETEPDEGVAGLKSATSHRRFSGQTAIKKRREFGRGGDYPRDYSVDEKSDALFREFSRCETETSNQAQQRLSSGRRLRHSHYPYPKLSSDVTADEDYGFSLSYADDETSLATVPIIRVAPDEDSSDQL
ncbi:uncharacterized protein LOC142323095 isoform X2 [Lycorma delicatula]|uniref:uncharacterized protein LOC142323095 isoform X2 n=1 Tax=Lycorma delicatula TaxID=130591 RepID=UPI003F510CE6